MKGTALPEFLSRHDIEGSSWTVEAGTPTRGDAWTDLTAHRMRVPVGDIEAHRIIRLHEMMHAKVSPSRMDVAFDYDPDVPTDLIVAGEEVRVNMLVREIGGDLDLLRDGSERLSGERIGQVGTEAWNSAVASILAMAGTKACNDYINGIAKSNPEMAAAARKVHSKIKSWHKKATKGRNTQWLGSTRDYEGLPIGFVRYTIPLAKYAAQFLIHETSEDEDDGAISDAIGDRVRGGGTPRFAPMILADIALPERVNGRIGRRRVASQTGKNPRRMNRMLTDPQQRVFDRRVRGKGGIIVIDQSGSMRLSHDDIWKMIEHAPACVIIGYSHQSGSTTVPNVWKIADRGRVCRREDLPDGNGGNGVDGPALRYAVKQRRYNEPIIWVCDGIVTDGENDRSYVHLDRECADLVVRHGIHMVPNVTTAIEALASAERGERLPMQGYGVVAMAIRSAYPT